MNNLFYKNTKCFPLPTNCDSRKKKKTNFKHIKNSLNDVECFLTKFHKVSDLLRLYKILK